MGRQRRDLTQSEWYHVYNRGADKQDIFSADSDRVLFEQLAAEAFGRFGVSLHAYALMTNHFHLLVHTPDGGLSEAMQRLCGRYGAAYNERVERTGSLFTGRFCSVAITSDAQLIWSGRYIHRNPLDIVPARALPAYRWSSLGCVLGRRTVPEWLAVGAVATGFATPDRYLQFVLTPQPSDRLDQGRLPPLRSTGCEEIERAVATVARLASPLEPLTGALRMLAITVALEARAADTAELAARYGLSDRSSVRRLARQGRVRTAESRAFAVMHAAVRRELASLPWSDGPLGSGPGGPDGGSGRTAAA
jgi:REP element-mobilizing transposase RayT